MNDGFSLGWYLPISSITRPSRFLRESTTTMRYCGTRTLPRRFKRILTATFVVSPQEYVGGEDPPPGGESTGSASSMGTATSELEGSGAQDSAAKTARRRPLQENRAEWHP